jgi:hypothetical protein
LHLTHYSSFARLILIQIHIEEGTEMKKSLKKSLSLTYLFSAISLLSGCASISSEFICSTLPIEEDKPVCNSTIDVDDGIAYYMPKRNIRLDISITQDPVRSPSTSPTETGTTSKPDPATTLATNQTYTSTETTTTTKTTATTGPLIPAAPPAKQQTKLTPAPTDDAKSYTATVTLVNNYATETTPDTANVFLLRYRKNYIAENNMALGVNSYGLLSVTHADSINKFDQIASNFARDAASIGMGAGLAPQAPSGPTTQSLTTYPGNLGVDYISPNNNQVIISHLQKNDLTKPDYISCTPGTYTVLINTDDFNYKRNEKEMSEWKSNLTWHPQPTLTPTHTCNLKIEITRLFSQNNLNNSYRMTGGHGWNNIKYQFNKAWHLFDIFNSTHSGASAPGMFYKQDLPYLVTVKHDKAQSQLVALSPNESKIFLAPITRTAFSDNVSDITMKNGVVLSLKENTDSELLALSKIPSNILGSYTNATGQIFSALGTVVTNKNADQTSELGLLKTEINIKKCQIALAQNPLTGLTGTVLATAQSNIQSACGN